MGTYLFGTAGAAGVCVVVVRIACGAYTGGAVALQAVAVGTGGDSGLVWCNMVDAVPAFGWW